MGTAITGLGDILDRAMCSVLDEMRSCCKTGNYSYLPSLIEEAQSYANRMEAALHRNNDWKWRKKDRKAMEKQVKQKQKELERLEKLIAKRKRSTQEEETKEDLQDDHPCSCSKC
jgi:hypothetical protein